MRVIPFPLCCGVNIVCDFGFTKTSMGSYGNLSYQSNVSLENIRKFLLREKKKCYNKRMKNYASKAFLVAILDATQKEHLHDLFVEEGFEPLATNLHKNHGNEVTIYAWANPHK